MPRDRRDGPGPSGSGGGSIAGSSDSRFAAGGAGAGRGGLRGRGVGGPGRGGGPVVGSRFVSGNGVAGAPKGPSGRGTGIRGRGGSLSTRAGARVVGTRNVPVGNTSINKPGSNKDGTGKNVVVDTEREKVAKEEARKRTLTDFRIVGLEIKSLGWKWGVVRPDAAEDDEDEEEEADDEAVVEGDQQAEQNETDQLRNGIAEEDAVERDVKAEPTDPSDIQVEVEVKVEQVPAETTQAASAETQDKETTNEVEGISAEATHAEVVKEESEEAQEIKDKADGSNVAAGAGGSTVEGKRGEKRKAKMSSPDAGLSPIPLSSLCAVAHRDFRVVNTFFDKTLSFSFLFRSLFHRIMTRSDCFL
jgi:hypothetical protein